jgi:hypothetical protein
MGMSNVLKVSLQATIYSLHDRRWSRRRIGRFAKIIGVRHYRHAGRSNRGCHLTGRSCIWGDPDEDDRALLMPEAIDQAVKKPGRAELRLRLVLSALREPRLSLNGRFRPMDVLQVILGSWAWGSGAGRDESGNARLAFGSLLVES